MAISAKLQARVVAIAEEIRRELYGEEGFPVSGKRLFVELEDAAVDVGDAITSAVLQQVLQAQAEAIQQAHPQEHRCGVCGHAAAASEEPDPRWLQTRRGDVGWLEPKYSCPKCRQAFFPSEQGTGN